MRQKLCGGANAVDGIRVDLEIWFAGIEGDIQCYGIRTSVGIRHGECIATRILINGAFSVLKNWLGPRHQTSTGLVCCGTKDGAVFKAVERIVEIDYLWQLFIFRNERSDAAKTAILKKCINRIDSRNTNNWIFAMYLMNPPGPLHRYLLW